MADKDELVVALRDAQEFIFQAIELLDFVVAETDDRHAKAYLVDHIKILTSDDHGFLSRDFNLDKWVMRVSGELDESGSRVE